MPFNPDIQRNLRGLKTKPVQIVDKLNNKQLRDRQFLSLARKFKPAIPRALKTMTDLLHVADSPGVRMQASKFVIDFYLDLVKCLYKEKYDNEKAEDIQPILQVYDSTNVEVLTQTEPEPEPEESTNKRLREKQLMQLSRKLKPHVKTALDTVNFLIEDKETPPAIKYQASKFLITTGKQLTESIYNDKYDEEIVEEEQDAAPVFSLRMQPVNK